MGRIQICPYELGARGKPRECSGAGGRIPSQPPKETTIVEVRDQIGVLSLSLFVCDRMWSSTNGLGTGFTTFGSQSSGGGVSPCTISAVR